MANEELTPNLTQQYMFREQQNSPDLAAEYAAMWEPGEVPASPSFVNKAIQSTKELGEELWKESWAGAGIRSLQRAANPSAEYDWRKEKLDQWKESGYSITPEEENAWLNTSARPTPDAVIWGEQERKDREEAWVASQGGKLRVIAKSIVDNPIEFAWNLIKGVLADPELLGLPSIYKGAFQATLKQFPKSYKAATAAGIASEAAVGGGMMAGGEALLSEEQTGMMDPERVKSGFLMGGALAGFVGAAQGFMGAVKRAGDIISARNGLNSLEVQASIHDYVKTNKVSYQVAVSRIAESYGIDPSALVADITRVAEKLEKEIIPEVKAKETAPVAPEGLSEPPSDITYRTGPVNQKRLEMATSGEGGPPPKPVSYGEGYGLIESREPDLVVAQRDFDRIKERYGNDIARIQQKERNITSGLNDAARSLVKAERQYTYDPAAHQSLIESIARKERKAAYPGGEREFTQADELFSYPAYRPMRGSLQQPVMSIQEFSTTSLGKSKNGKPLSGAALQKRYQKFHRELQGINKDPTQIVTRDELEQIMTENSSQMKDFFLQQARREGSRGRVPAKFKSQQGKANTDLLTYLGAAGLGTLILYSKDHDINQALTYILLGGVSLVGGAKFLKYANRKWPVANHLMNTKTGIKIDDLLNTWSGEGAVAERKIMQDTMALKAVSGEIPGWSTIARAKRREAKALRKEVTAALEDKSGKKYDKLSALGKELHDTMKERFESAAKRGTDEGVLNDVLDYYVPHAWQHPTKSTEELLDTLFGTKSRAESMDTIHKQKRVIPTYALGKKLGLRPRTEDIVDLYSMYMSSLDRAIRSKQLMEALKNTTNPLDNKKLLVRRGNAPRNYQSISHPKFDGWKVHPDIKPAIQAMFGSGEKGVMMRGVQGLNYFLKRMLVSLSGFHAKALLMSNLMAGGVWRAWKHPITGTADLINMFKGKSPALQMLYGTMDEGTKGTIDRALRNGLILNMVDDVGKDTFYEALEDLEGALRGAYERSLERGLGAKAGGQIARAASLPVRGIKGLNRLVDAVMWDRIYTSLKLTTYMDRMNMLTNKYGDTVSHDLLSQWAAEFTNDAFGGLNWLRLAQNVENKYGSKLAYSLAGKSGRENMQLGLFAPDWTTSNVRVFYKAFANKNKIQRDLYQRYQFNGMLMFMVGADALNYTLTGHHIWDNKDIGSVELGDGRRISLSKQWWEPAHWILKPQQSFLNKVSTIFSTGMEIATGNQYMTSTGRAPRIEDQAGGYLGHILMKGVPIGMQQGIKTGDPMDTLLSTAGFPRYGQVKPKKTARKFSRGGKGSKRSFQR